MLNKTTRLSVTQQDLGRVKADLLVVGLFQSAPKIPKNLLNLNQISGNLIQNLLNLRDFQGKLHENSLLYPQKPSFPRLMLIGLGEEKSLQLNHLRQTAALAVRAAEKLAAPRVALALHAPLGESGWGGQWERVGQAIAEGAIVGRYDYQEFLSPPKDRKRVVEGMEVLLIDRRSGVASKLAAGVRVGRVLGEAQNRARAIDNRPGNEINPAELGRQAQRLARRYGLRCRVYDERRLAQMGMNALLAVGSGSAAKPRLIELEYRGRRGRGGRGRRPDVVLVGKAITFDSGGISIKPSQNMETMKYDKSGGCDVLGVLTGLAELRLPLDVAGLIPAAENLPSGTSYRPGDIVRTYGGKTVEIQNTDAEGRLILCDALAYAAAKRPGAIVDLATLTGACAVALGEHHAGLFGNREDLRKELEEAAARSGEAVWAMPSGSEYLEQMKSKMADLKNTGGREGGACTAAAFLQEFVGQAAWAHLDIAAVADSDKEKPYRGVGATGFGVRLILEWLRARRKRAQGE